MSSHVHAHLQTAVRGAPLSPPSRLSFTVERSQTLDRLQRTASDFDVRLLADKSMTLPKSDGSRLSHRRGGNASDGDDIDVAPGRLTEKRRTRIWFKNLFRSADKSSSTTKAFGPKKSGRKMWENCV